MDKEADTSRITRVNIKAYGPFAFSHSYDDGAVSELLLEAVMANTMFATLPILPEWSAQLNEDLIVRSIFGTAAIEGSPLSETEVSGLLEAGRVIEPKAARERTITNLREAYRLAGVGGRSAYDPQYRLSEERVCQLHAAICNGLDDARYHPGHYRLKPVSVGDADHGGTYRPPKVPEDISMLMARFVEWANGQDVNVKGRGVVRAFLVHYHLSLIHPFADGNGRVARVVEAEILEKAGFRFVPLMMSNYYYENIHDYYRAFTETEKNHFDMTPFLEFCLKGLVKCCGDIQERVTYYIRRLTLREYYSTLRKKRALTRRQHDFLLLLLDHGKPLTLASLTEEPKFRILYAAVSSQTARRDLRKLSELGLLSRASDNSYELNLKAIG